MSVLVAKLRIGEVHTVLRHDFPDIELSKIRYYEDKGLVLPARSRKGYRLYSERDVACLREAIRLAQEEFVPLRVVRLRLIEQGLLDATPAVAVVRQAAREASNNAVTVVVAAVGDANVLTHPRFASAPVATGPVTGAPEEIADDSSPHYFTTAEFFTETGLEAKDVNQLIALGLLVPATVENETAFSSLDVRVGRAAGSLLVRGVDLRLLGSLRRVVERELGVVDDLTLAIRLPGSGLSVAQVRSIAGEVASEVAILRSVLHDRALQDYLNE